MIELVRALRGRGVPVGVVSNSEGRLAELIAEIGWGEEFLCVADSGKLGIEKPDPAIFHLAAEALGVAAAAVIHVGDSFGADVRGALGAGLQAVWFRGRGAPALPEGVRRAEDAPGLAAALREMGLG
jgi:putative hydrolase of the HAD superfamily